MVDNEKFGTGEIIATVTIDGRTFEISDDGDRDHCVNWKSSMNSGNHRDGLSKFVKRLRKEYGDEKAGEMLEGLQPGNGSTESSGSSGPSPSDWMGSASFTCRSCDTMWPNNQEFRPDPNDELCADCSGD